MHIINLKNHEKIINAKKYLQSLLKHKTFILRNNTLSIECAIIKSKLSSISLTDFHYYTIKDLNGGFVLSFTKNWLPTFTEVYIQSVKKTKNISGSKIIDILIKFISKFESVKVIKLVDEAAIICPTQPFRYNLSLFSLLTANKSFYAKFNFELQTPNAISDKKISKIIDVCSNTKIAIIIKQLQQNTDILNSLNLPKNSKRSIKNVILNLSFSNVENIDNKIKIDQKVNPYVIYTDIVSLIQILRDNFIKNETFKSLLIRLRLANKCKHIATILRLCLSLCTEMWRVPKKK